MKRILCSIVALGLLAAQAQADYVFTTLDAPAAIGTEAHGINNLGQIVGVAIAGAASSSGFLLTGGNYTLLDAPGAPRTDAQNINDSGQIIGYYQTAPIFGPFSGFLFDGANYTTLVVPASVSTLSRGINNSGQIVGDFTNSPRGGTEGFLLSGGNYSPLPLPAAVLTETHAINNAGDIVGGYISELFKGFLLQGSNVTLLDVPGSTLTRAFGINNSNMIVGFYSDSASHGHGFLLSNGAYTTLDFPGAIQTVAHGINDAGAIVGSYLDANRVVHGFLATPMTTFAWHAPAPIFTGATRNPSFIQAIPGTYGTKGNYELVVPLQSGGLGHFYRDNDDPNLPWNGPFTFATDQGAVDAVSLLQSNFTSSGSGPGNLAVVARIGDTLDYFFREDVSFTWSGPTAITTGVGGVASFLQARPGTYGTMGNYELVTPLQSGGLGAFERNNDHPRLPWMQTDTFGTDLGLVDAVSLIQSNFSTQFVQTGVQGPGNLAVVARVGTTLYYFYRDDIAPFAWHGPTMTIATGVSGNPSFVQATPGTYGSMGNYELVVPLLSGGIAHFERNNDDPSLPWSMTATFATSLGAVDGVSLIQSNFSTAGNGPGNLAVVSVASGQLYYFYRDDN